MIKAIDYASRVTCVPGSMQEFSEKISTLLRADGIPHAPAVKDASGRCIICGLAWLCPGVHTFEEIQEAARKAARANGGPAPSTITPAILAEFQKITPRGQFETVKELLRGEERSFFEATILRLVSVWQGMPKTYETDGQGMEAMAQLHYFKGGCDWSIIEKDKDEDSEGQLQAFGVAGLGMGRRERGYINLAEILAAGAELDFYYTPQKVGDILKGG